MKINNQTPEQWFEKFMQSLKESNEKLERDIEKSRREADKRSAEFDARLEKSNAEFEKWRKEMQKKIGGIGESNGDVAEEAIYNVLKKDMTFAGIKFDFIRNNIQLQSEDHRTLTELDLLLVNGDTVSLIETKYKVEQKDISYLINKQLPYFRECHPKYDNHKIVLGIGGLSFDSDAELYANANGIGIIKVIGDKIECYTEGIRMY